VWHQGELYIYKASLGKANLFGIKGIQITNLQPKCWTGQGGKKSKTKKSELYSS